MNYAFYDLFLLPKLHCIVEVALILVSPKRKTANDVLPALDAKRRLERSKNPGPRSPSAKMNQGKKKESVY